MPNFLAHAVYKGQHELVAFYLKEKSYDLNKPITLEPELKSLPPHFLHIAVSPVTLTPSHLETIQVLLRHGASIESANGLGSLLCRLVDKNLQSPVTCKTVIEIINILYRNGEAIPEDIFTILLNAYEKLRNPSGVLKNSADEQHENNILAVLQELHVLKNMNIFMTYIKNGDLKNAKAMQRKTDWIAHPDWPTDILFSVKINPHFDGGKSGVPLFRAAELPTPDMLIFLREIGVDLSYTDAAGKTAFHYAIRQGRIENIQWMWGQLSNEQKVVLLSQPLYQPTFIDPKTPKELALENGHAELADLLQQYENEITPSAPAPKKRRLGMTGSAQNTRPLPYTPLLQVHGSDSGPTESRRTLDESEPYFSDDATDPYPTGETTPALLVLLC